MSWPGHFESDNIKGMITLTVITLSGAYCILFDSKLKLNHHIAKAIIKAKRTDSSLNLTHKILHESRRAKMLIVVNFYSVLYYCSDIWLITSRNANIIKNLL